MFGDGLQKAFGPKPTSGETVAEAQEAENAAIFGSQTHSTFGTNLQELVTGAQPSNEISLPGTIVSSEALKAALETLAGGGCKFWVAKTQDLAEQYPDAIEPWRAAALAADGINIVIADHEHNLPLIIRRNKDRDAEQNWVFVIEAM